MLLFAILMLHTKLLSTKIEKILKAKVAQKKNELSSQTYPVKQKTYSHCLFTYSDCIIQSLLC